MPNYFLKCPHCFLLFVKFLPLMLPVWFSYVQSGKMHQYVSFTVTPHFYWMLILQQNYEHAQHPNIKSLIQ